MNKWTEKVEPVLKKYLKKRARIKSSTKEKAIAWMRNRQKTTTR